jgi:hypothetical protein
MSAKRDELLKKKLCAGGRRRRWQRLFDFLILSY